jgi:hypothetical protein
MSLFNTAIEYGFKIIDNLINSKENSNKTHEVTTGISGEQLLHHLEIQKTILAMNLTYRLSQQSKTLLYFLKIQYIQKAIG